MRQNTSSAVMAQRREAPDSLDYFPTPPWATRALCEHLAEWGDPSKESVWEPACGEGHMARPLAEYFRTVVASDIHGYGFGTVHDFLSAGTLLEGSPPIEAPDWVITNPPFNKAQEFALRAAEIAREGFALLVRTAFLEGGGRLRELFEPMPPEWILQFSERVAMVKGRVDKDAQSATAYCWVIWTQPALIVERGRLAPHFPAFRWIAPCRKRLERAEDWQ